MTTKFHVFRQVIRVYEVEVPEGGPSTNVIEMFKKLTPNWEDPKHDVMLAAQLVDEYAGELWAEWANAQPADDEPLCRFCGLFMFQQDETCLSEKRKHEPFVNPKLAQELARQFSIDLYSSTSPEERRTILERNKGYIEGGSTTCATHDFMDANVVMEQSFNTTLGREPDFLTDEHEDGADTRDMALWNAAWMMARAQGFWWPESKRAS